MLTLQACLPLSYGVSKACFVPMQANVHWSHFQEHAVFAVFLRLEIDEKALGKTKHMLKQSGT